MSLASYLVGKEFRFPQLRSMIRKTLNINEKQSIVFYIGKQLVNEEQMVGDIYASKKDAEDGFLYINYTDMEVFGL